MSLMEFSSGSLAHRKILKRRLNAAGGLNHHCTMLASNENMDSLEQAALLAENLAFLIRQKTLESEATKATQQQHLIEEAPSALIKLKIACGSGPIDFAKAKLTTNQLRALAFRYLGTDVKKENKETVLKTVVDLSAKLSGRLEKAMNELSEDATPDEPGPKRKQQRTTAPRPTGNPQVHQDDDEDGADKDDEDENEDEDEDEDETEQTAAAAAAAAESSEDDELFNKIIDAVACRKCGSLENGDEMLLCEHWIGPDQQCSAAMHIWCLPKPLKAVPVGKCFCPEHARCPPGCECDKHTTIIGKRRRA
jgi:hypothetical protein